MIVHDPEGFSVSFRKPSLINVFFQHFPIVPPFIILTLQFTPPSLPVLRPLISSILPGEV